MKVYKTQTLNLKRFTIPSLILIFFIFHSFYFPGDDKGTEPELISKARSFNEMYPSEKLYLHLDRSTYRATEDIWFKAYLLNPFYSQCNVYVELVNTDGKVLNRNKCWALGGVTYGSFHLVDTLEAGVYQIRAYTDWMRNFDDFWFFRKNIVIWGSQENALTTKESKIRSSDIELQFFPEGGTFIGGIENKVAYKAIDRNGKGLKVKGIIEDNKGNKILDFESSHNGMGTITFTPQIAESYKAVAMVGDNWDKNVNLPKVSPNGVKLAANYVEGNQVTLKVNTAGLDSGRIYNFNIAGQSGDEICYVQNVNLVDGSAEINIEKDSLPTGIVRFTLFDEGMMPLCERLVFVNNNDFIAVDIDSDKELYDTREKVTLNIETLTNNADPIRSNLSLSVYNPQNQLVTEKYPENILTRFFLSSELKGHIEEPAWYFKDDSISTKQALDLLMLTHGYRYFSWEQIEKNWEPVVNYPPETSIRVWGRVSHVLTGKPIAETKVTLMVTKGSFEVRETTTDSLGFFVFEDFFFTETMEVALQAGEEKERRNYWIDVDSRTSIPADANFLPLTYDYVNEKPVITTYYLFEENEELINKKWHLSDTIMLSGISVVANKALEVTVNMRPYLDADYVFDVTKHDYQIYSNISDMIVETSGYLRNFLNHNPQYYLDGVMVDADFIEGLPASWVDKVEVLKMAPTSDGVGPAIFFYTKRGENSIKTSDGVGKKSAVVRGYTPIRNFYSPDYEEMPNLDEADYRNTLFWDPMVNTDSTGVAQVTFFNSDEPGNWQVVVEGVTTDGKLCRGVQNYVVKP